jgi:energy-coupling factor transport system permease protein
VRRLPLDFRSKKKLRSLFQTLDPRVVIVLFGALLVLTFLIGRTVGLLILFLYIIALFFMAGLRGRTFVETAKNLSLFVVLIVAINAFLVDGTPLPAPLNDFSREGLAFGVFYSMRVVVLYFTVILFLSLTSQEAMARGLSVLLKPISTRLSRRVALYGFLSIGFLPLFVDEIRRIRIAQRFRGGGFEGGPMRKLASVRLLLVPLLISAIHRSGQLAMAVELRGIRETIGHVLHLDAPGYRDVVFTGVTLAVVTVAVLI